MAKKPDPEIEAIKARLTELEESSARAYEWLEGVDEVIYKCIEHMAKRSWVLSAIIPLSSPSPIGGKTGRRSKMGRVYYQRRKWWERRPPLCSERWEDRPDYRVENNGRGMCNTGADAKGACSLGGYGCNVDHEYLTDSFSI